MAQLTLKLQGRKALFGVRYQMNGHHSAVLVGKPFIECHLIHYVCRFYVNGVINTHIMHTLIKCHRLWTVNKIDYLILFQLPCPT